MAFDSSQNSGVQAEMVWLSKVPILLYSHCLRRKKEGDYICYSRVNSTGGFTFFIEGAGSSVDLKNLLACTPLLIKAGT